MPIAGSEQQRLKSNKELLLERRLLEYEISKIIEDRNSLEKRHEDISRKLMDEMKKNMSDLSDSAEKRLRIEERIGAKTEQIRHSSGDQRKQFEAQLQSLERRLRDQISEEKILGIQTQKLEERLKIEKLILQEEEGHRDNLIGFLGKFGEVFSIQKKYNDGLKKAGGSLAKNRLILGSMLTVLELSFTAFRHFDDELAKFRITMGMLRTDAFRISTVMKQVAIEMAHVGVTIEGATAATMALANEFGGTMKVSKDLVESTALLKAQLGVAEETSAGFLRNISALSRTTAQAQRHMVFFADALSSAAGVPLNMVMQDVAKMSGNALALISKMPGQIVKTAVAARQMGTTINKMADASANILNFTESVQAEMEASVLVGEAVNIQQARQLAYQGKIVESTKAIVREAKRINVEKLDFFQMQAFAAASGRSAEELLKMIQAERQLNAARNDASLGLQSEVAAYDRLMAMKDADLHNEGLQRELMVKRLANQARMEILQQHFNQMILQMGEILFPIFDKSIQFIGFLMQWTKGVMNVLLPLKAAAGAIDGMVVASLALGATWKPWMAVFMNISKFLGTFVERILTFGAGTSRIVGLFGKMGILGKMLLPFAKVLGPIGWIITAIQLIASIWKNFDPKAPFFGLDKVIKEVLLDPFIKAWDWIKGIFVGHSPSKLMIGVIRGIVSAQAKIFDALTYPWRHFLAWVIDKIPGMGGLAKKLRGGLEGGLEDAGILEKKAATPETTPLAVTTEATAAPTTTVTTIPTAEEQKRRDADSTTLGNILAALNTLNSNLAAGKIGVNIDGQLMSATLSRQTQFKGGYGMNVV